jgi:hypothetical protein
MIYRLVNSGMHLYVDNMFLASSRGAARGLSAYFFRDRAAMGRLSVGQCDTVGSDFLESHPRSAFAATRALTCRPSTPIGQPKGGWPDSESGHEMNSRN